MADRNSGARSGPHHDRRRERDRPKNLLISKPRNEHKTKHEELDPERLRARQKQIDYGKNTIGYDNYTRSVARSERDPAKKLSSHPQTPDIHRKCSKRAFAGQIKVWRRLLHLWDDKAATQDQAPTTVNDVEPDTQEDPADEHPVTSGPSVQAMPPETGGGDQNDILAAAADLSDDYDDIDWTDL